MKYLQHVTQALSSIKWLWLLSLLLITLPSQLSAEVTEKVTYYHYALSKQPFMATDQDGKIVWETMPHSFGGNLPLHPNMIKFDHTEALSGHIKDKRTGLIYMQGRYYDPRLKRFLGADPVGVILTNVHSFSRYAYANNNPYRYFDPNGKWSVDINNCIPIVEGGYCQNPLGVGSSGGRVGGGSKLGVNNPSNWGKYHGNHSYAESGRSGIYTKITRGLASNPMYKHAISQFKRAGWTHVGRGATKHPNILGVNVPKDQVQKALITKYGSQTNINKAAANALKNIMHNGVQSTKMTRAYGQVTEFKLNNGFGARFNSQTNEFIGFLGRGL